MALRAASMTAAHRAWLGEPWWQTEDFPEGWQHAWNRSYSRVPAAAALASALHGLTTPNKERQRWESKLTKN